jgi:hypothetical protein
MAMSLRCCAQEPDGALLQRHGSLAAGLPLASPRAGSEVCSCVFYNLSALKWCQAFS